MTDVTWTHTPPVWLATQNGQTVCTLKSKDIGGWTASWSGDRLWAPPAHTPKAAPQPTRFFFNLQEAQTAVEQALAA